MERRTAEREAKELAELRRLRMELADGEPHPNLMWSELLGEQLDRRLRWLELRARELELRARRSPTAPPRRREPLRAIEGEGEGDTTAQRGSLRIVD